MTVYYLMISSMLFFSFFHRINYRKLEFENYEHKSRHKHIWEVGRIQVSWNKAAFIVLFMMFLSIAGFRAMTVGKDVPQYALIFSYRKNYGLIDSITGVEPLFNILNKIIGLFTENFQIVLFLYSALILTGPFYLIRKFSNNPYYSLFLYITMGFQATSFSGIRTSMAMSVLCFAIVAAKERNLWRFLLLVVLACLFHRTAIAFIIVYPMMNRRLTTKSIVITLAAAVAAYCGGELFFQLLTKISLFSKYSIFIKKTGSITYDLVILIVFLIVYFYYGQTKEKYGNVDFLYYMILMAFLVQLLGAYNTNIMRLTYYFYMAALVLIPNVFDSIGNIRERKIMYIAFSFLMVIQYLIVFRTGYGAENYLFFWEQA